LKTRYSVVYNGELCSWTKPIHHIMWLLRALNPPGVSPLFLLLILLPKWINGQC
jgi:hypothetical protein